MHARQAPLHASPQGKGNPPPYTPTGPLCLLCPQDDYCFRPDPVYDFGPDYGWEVSSSLEPDFSCLRVGS